MAFQTRRFTFLPNNTGTISIARPSDATAYAAGDEIANSATAGSVIRPTIDLSHISRARIVRMGIAVTPASGNLVIAAFDFAALVFHTKDVPAAVGDNVAINILANSRIAASKFAFANGAWTAPNGGVAAGTDGFQEQLAAISANFEDGPVFDFTSRPDIDKNARGLSLVLQAQGAWNPGAVVNNFVITADIQLD